jgi:NAD(P)H dehydrogenase (quinone)
MKVLVICAHPNPKSFNHAILESFTAGLTEGGHEYEIIDLYDAGFNPCLSMADLQKVMQGGASDDVKIQQEKIAQAEGLCIIHPIWWTGAPAILKGWIDRVFSLGFAYNFDRETGAPMGLLKLNKGIVFNTAGGSKEDLERVGLPATIRAAEVDGVFGFCGVQDVKHVIFYSVIMTDDATRKGYLDEARQLGKTF